MRTSRRALLAGGLAALLGTSLVTSSTPAANGVEVRQSFRMAGSTVLLAGHGFGHGHGMSQYGAQGAAKQGLAYKQIVDFYYPGTSWSLVTGKVRVLITADTTSDVVVKPVAGLRPRPFRKLRHIADVYD